MSDEAEQGRRFIRFGEPLFTIQANPPQILRNYYGLLPIYGQLLYQNDPVLISCGIDDRNLGNRTFQHLSSLLKRQGQC